MSHPLSMLHTIRKMQQERKRRAFSAAKRTRDAQEERLNALVEEVNTIRDGGDSEEAHWIAQRQSWCLQMEMRRRREQHQLDKDTAEAEQKHQELQAASKDEQIVDLIVNEYKQAAALEQRREEERLNNELASQGWWRQCG